MPTPLVAGQAEPEGPAFGERSLALIDLPILHFGPVDPAPIARGETRWSLTAGYASSFSKTWHAATVHRETGRAGRSFSREEADLIHRNFPADAVVFVDGEVVRSSLRARAGVTGSVSVSVEVPILSFPSFTADSTVEGFHDTFGISQAGRDAFPHGQLLFALQRPGGRMHFVEGTPGTRLGDVAVVLSWRPRSSAASVSFGADASLKAPTGSRASLAGSGSWDAGVLLFARLAAARWSLGAEAALVAPGPLRLFDDLSTEPFSRFLVSAGVRLGSRSGLGVSLAYEQSALRENDLGGISRGGLEAAIGLEWRTGARTAARLTFIENVIGDRADVGLVLALIHR